jgi:hypothetical protein
MVETAFYESEMVHSQRRKPQLPTPPKRFYLDLRRTRYKYTQVYQCHIIVLWYMVALKS